MNNKPLLLVSSISETKNKIGAEIAKFNNNTFAIYIQVNILLRFLRTIHLRLKLPYFHIWYGPWKYCVSNNSSIILFDSLLDTEIIDFITNKSRTEEY